MRVSLRIRFVSGTTRGNVKGRRKPNGKMRRRSGEPRSWNETWQKWYRYDRFDGDSKNQSGRTQDRAIIVGEVDSLMNLVTPFRSLVLQVHLLWHDQDWRIWRSKKFNDDWSKSVKLLEMRILDLKLGILTLSLIPRSTMRPWLLSWARTDSCEFYSYIFLPCRGLLCEDLWCATK